MIYLRSGFAGIDDFLKLRELFPASDTHKNFTA